MFSPLLRWAAAFCAVRGSVRHGERPGRPSMPSRHNGPGSPKSLPRDVSRLMRWAAPSNRAASRVWGTPGSERRAGSWSAPLPRDHTTPMDTRCVQGWPQQVPRRTTSSRASTGCFIRPVAPQPLA